MNVIVFEREEDIKDLLSYNLRKSGYNVIPCCERNELCSCLDTSDPQLIIIGNLDWDEDIFAFARDVRAKFKDHHFALIALTTHTEAIPQMSDSGLFDMVLSTPLKPKNLIGEIDKLVNIPLIDAA